MNKKELQSMMESKKAAVELVDVWLADLKTADEHTKAEVEKWRKDDEGRAKLKSLIALNGAHYSHSAGTLKGVVYVVEEDMPASKVIQLADLMGGVSVYRVKKISNEKGVKKPEHVLKRVRDLKKKPLFTDTSLLASSRQGGVSLGALDGSIGIYEALMNDETFEKQWFIVVRSYHAPSAKLVMDKIKSGELPTVESVYNSEEYNRGLELSEKSRNALALTFAKHIGAELTDGVVSSDFDANTPTVQMAVPYISGQYNVIQKIQDFRGSLVYAFYAGCFGYAERLDRGLICGLSRADGWMLILPEDDNDEKRPIGRVSNAYAFPLGAPKRTEGAVKLSLANMPEKSKQLIHWAADLDYNEKAHPLHYNVKEVEAGITRTEIATLGLQNGSKLIKLATRGVYISSPQEIRLSVEDLVSRQSGKDVIRVPISHTFVHDYLIAGFQLLKQRDSSTRLTGEGGIILAESRLYFEIKAAVVKEIIALVSGSRK